jgi:hypothetical protein
MNLITAHKILIGAALGFFLLFGVVEIFRGHWLASILALGVSIALFFYYRWVSKNSVQPTD